MTWVDSHCHIQLMDDPSGLLGRARAAGVDTVVVVGTDLGSSLGAIHLAGAEPQVRATVGLHPHDASHLDDQWDDLVEASASEGVVAIGEAGFDLHYRHSEPDVQEEAFRRQIALAKQRDLTLVIHTREAWDDTFRVLEDEGPPARVVFHCFTGGPDEARRALEIGAHLSYSGIVTFPGAEEVRAAAAITPIDRVLVETDAPYLTPVPHRGRTNEPAHVVLVGAAVARAADVREETLAQAVSATASTLFGGT